MVSLCQNKTNKHYRIVFDDAAGGRRTLRLGKIAKSIAESIRTHIRNLRKAKYFGGTLSDATSQWLNEIDPEFKRRLMAFGLVDDPDGESQPPVKHPAGETLSAFLDKYKYHSKVGSSMKPLTKRVRDAAAGHLLKFFGPEKPLTEINEGDAIDFRNYLLDVEGLIESTVRKRCQIARTLFKHALKRELITSNPFLSDEIPTASLSTEAKHFVTTEAASKVLAKLPTLELQTLFALSRWGGLRVGSEVRLLRWVDIDWKAKRFTVHSPKTERYRGKAKRVLPLFPELATMLEALYREADDFDLYVLPFLHGRTDQAVRNPVERAIKDAGEKVWPRLWHNMRLSRQTELTRDFPRHVVCEWLGNSEEVAEEHYLVSTDDDFTKASEALTSTKIETAPSAKTARTPNCARSSDAQACTENPRKVPVSKNTEKSGPDASLCSPVHECTSDQSSPARIRT